MEDCIGDLKIMLSKFSSEQKTITAAFANSYSSDQSFLSLVVCANSGIEVNENNELVTWVLQK